MMRRMNRSSLTAEEARERLDYDPLTGAMRWKHDPKQSRSWNTRYAGTEPPSLDAYGYRRLSINDRPYKVHRLAWLMVTGDWPPHQIDHINGDRADNRFANLRPASKSLNGANAKRRTDNTIGLKGVRWDKRRNHWTATIQVNGKKLHLGRFESPETAHAAYLRAAQHHFGDFSHSGQEARPAYRPTPRRE
jgi:hypothetical protein